MSDPIGPSPAAISAGLHALPLPVGLDPTVAGVSGAVGDIRQSADHLRAWVKYGPGAFEWAPFPSTADQPAYRTGAIDCTVGGLTSLVPQQTGKSWKTTRLEVEVVASDISGMTLANSISLGANSPGFDNLIARPQLGLSGQQPGEILRYGASLPSVDVGSHDLTINVAQAQVGGASSAIFRIWGVYV